MNRFLLPLGACLIASASVRAGTPELLTVESATEVVRSFSALQVASIPPAMLRDAAGVAIIPDLVKAGFLIGGRFGRGVVLPRHPDGTWGDPVFVTLAGGGFGLQAGIQSTDVILVFKTARSLDRVLRGKGKVTLGGDIGIAAGPVGRRAEAATDGQLKAEIYSYSRSRGLFAGVSLEGAAIWPDAVANANFYRERGPTQAATTKLLKGWLASQSAPPVVAPAPPVIVPAPPVVVPAPPVADSFPLPVPPPPPGR